jgi:RNA polymerase sigma-70 factor, ECF subfamily
MAATPADPPETQYALVTRSLDDLYRAEYPQLVRTVMVLTRRRDVAEELVQDAFTAAHRRWETVGRLDRPDAWVRRVALNAAISASRRRATEARLIFRLSRERSSTEWTLRTNEVWEAIRSLPGRQAQVAVLVLVEDRPIAEAALVLDCGEETVRTHLRRARIAIAQRIGGDNDGLD